MTSRVVRSGFLTGTPFSSGIGRVRVPANVGFVLSMLGLQVVLFGVLRLLLYWRNRDLADEADLVAIMRSFALGARFDLATAAYLILPQWLLARFASLRWGTTGERRVGLALAIAFGSALIVLGIVELEFYHEYSCRFNRLLVQYLTQPLTVLSMVWKGFPVLRYLALAALLIGGYAFGVMKLARFWFTEESKRPAVNWSAVIGMAATAIILLIAARGGLQRKPLQWGDAVASKSVFANHLAQNGFWMLAKDLFGGTGHSGASERLRDTIPIDVAHARVQRLLGLPEDEFVGASGDYPILRQSRGGARQESLRGVSDRPPNVVIFMMESFSARFVGAICPENNLTPEFDRLSKSGILFDRGFSNGTRTHQAHYTILASFPNLPGTEWLMQDRRGDQRFDSIPSILKSRGYQTMYFQNGKLDWDNVEGFFKFQGVDRFVGVRDFDKSKEFVGTWGVLDNVLFERANREFAKIDGPFCATIMTASNHIPFECPRPYPFPEVTDAGKWNDRFNGIRFADWSIGQFFELAQTEKYFQNTLFILVGDHGINSPPILTELNLLHHHVPLLFYSPSLLGAEGRRVHTVASHVDIAPTILGLLGVREPHQHWGRDLFALPDGDDGLAVIKPTAEPVLGYVRGNTLLVKPVDSEGRLYHYDLGCPPSVDEFESAVEVEEMQSDLHSYVQTGLEVLESRHAAADSNVIRR